MKIEVLKLWLIVSFLLLSGCEIDKPKVYAFSYAGATMGTSFSIKSSYLPPEISIKQLQELITTRLNEINQRMSTYIKDSELSQINQAQTKDNLSVSPELFKVLKAAEKVSIMSKGAFDITVAPLVNLWGFGPGMSLLEAPPAENVTTLLSRIGYQKLQLNTDELTLNKKESRLSMDLSGLAKGYAVDEVALILEQQGIEDYLVEIGGELRLKGHNLQGKKWHIAIEKPTTHKRELQKVIPITNTAMATSGDYRNFFEQDGKRFSHTIDPRTGYPITHQLASVTVLHASSMMADAWATALMVLGSDVGYNIAEKQQLAAFFIIKKQQGFAEQATPLFIKQTKVEK